MTQREEFEKWFFENGFLKSATIGEKMLMLQAWKAAKEQAVPEWIPVSERLPDEDAVVVGRSDDPIEYCDYAVFNFFNGIFHLNTDGLEASNYDGGAVIKCEFAVTHWMPLPAAPEQNK